ncbi:hypothetical protein U6A24_01175 [Aquimarina gracilis]|uniref:Microcystin-dependent protein n=1 Tax=Aquimarina gracilis TaxID=874422 RepID=A0ABU5ZPM3_9FLAO|nr:hypothetical protein [Aquimarina gracilis]MEB3344049.1 hypothetical protein [Aquimarina gracilis]
MEINKKNRTELKEYFKINDKPTQEEFSDFIEAGLNQAEDSIAKVQGNPLSIQAEGERVGTQEVLDLYENFADDNPQWSVNLNPRVNSNEPTSNQPGFNIKDATGQSRLFIKSGEGTVGIGTVEPVAPLTVKGNTTSDKPIGAMQIAEDRILFGGKNTNEHKDSAKIEVGTTTLTIFGKSTNSDSASRKLDIIADGGTRIQGAVSVEGDMTIKNLKAENISPSVDLDKEGASHQRIPTQMAVKTYVDTRMPKGVIVMWSGNISSIPVGWVLCDGSQGTPDLSGKFVAGFEKDNPEYQIGKTGGKDAVTLTKNQLPAHNHSGNTSETGDHIHDISHPASGNDSGNGLKTITMDGETHGALNTKTKSAGKHKHSFTTNSVGGNQPHENRPPYFALAYIMKL